MPEVRKMLAIEGLDRGETLTVCASCQMDEDVVASEHYDEDGLTCSRCGYDVDIAQQQLEDLDVDPLWCGEECYACGGEGLNSEGEMCAECEGTGHERDG